MKKWLKSFGKALVRNDFGQIYADLLIKVETVNHFIFILENQHFSIEVK